MSKSTTPKAMKPSTPLIEDDRTSMSVEGFKRAVMNHLYYSVGVIPAVADAHDAYRALALAVRDRMQHRWMNSTQT
jgi:starch phosphorylase